MDHDRLFKELLTTFFPQFLQLFCPELAANVDPDSLEFLGQGDFHRRDARRQARGGHRGPARFQGEGLGFLIHVEPQARRQTHFPRRMFTYFARFHQKYDMPVYPIALFSHRSTRREQGEYRIDFPDLKVLAFQFRVVQLSRLKWRDFLDRMNPIVAALMSNMAMRPVERPLVKLACLRMLAQLQLDPARRQLISGFIDEYLQLTIEEKHVFEAEFEKLVPQEKEGVMEIVTSWMKEGLEKGREQGMEQGTRQLLMRQLREKLGGLGRATAKRVEALPKNRLEELGVALLDFTCRGDLDAWLQSHRP